jgi:hypothetical protein
MDGGTWLVGVCVGEGAGGQLGGRLQGAPVRQGGGGGGERGLVQQAVVQGHTETRFDSIPLAVKSKDCFYAKEASLYGISFLDT